MEAAGLEISAIESVPVPEAIKMGVEPRDRYIENYKETLRNLAKAGIKVVTYNFMPVFDWTRSELDHKLNDGSEALIYKKDEADKMDPVEENLICRAGIQSYNKEELNNLMTALKRLLI